MLPRPRRITSGQDFARVVRQGRRLGSSTCVLHALMPDPDGADGVRWGLIVSKSVGNAVTRNRVKRRLRHIARDQMPVIPGNAAFVLRANPASAAATSGRLAADVEQLIRRAVAAAEPA